jgi:hypothetical protein
MNLNAEICEEQIAKINRNIIRLGELMSKLQKQNQLPQKFNECITMYENIGYGLDENEQNCDAKINMLIGKMNHCLKDFDQLDLPQQQLLGDFNQKLLKSLLCETVLLMQVYSQGEELCAMTLGL